MARLQTKFQAIRTTITWTANIWTKPYQMQCLFGTSLPEEVFLLPSSQPAAFSHSPCPLRTPPSSPVLTWELWELHMESHVNEVSAAKHRYFPTLSQDMEKWMWMVYAVMNQAVWILQVKDIRCNSHVNTHMVPLPPESHTSDMQATFCIPYICENVLLDDSKDSKQCRKDKHKFFFS